MVPIFLPEFIKQTNKPKVKKKKQKSCISPIYTTYPKAVLNSYYSGEVAVSTSSISAFKS